MFEGVFCPPSPSPTMMERLTTSCGAGTWTTWPTRASTACCCLAASASSTA
ncbi:MAG: hypothetical protein ACLU0O_12850 [Collinsella sp.]